MEFCKLTQKWPVLSLTNILSSSMLTPHAQVVYLLLLWAHWTRWTTGSTCETIPWSLQYPFWLWKLFSQASVCILIRSSVSLFKQGLCTGADDGDIHALLCNLQPYVWERPFLLLPFPPGRGFLRNGVRIRRNFCPQLEHENHTNKFELIDDS